MMLIIINLDLLGHILTAAGNISLVQLLWPLWSLLGRLGQGSGLQKVTGGILVSLSPRHQNSTCQLHNHGKAHITSACTFQTSSLSNPADLVWDRPSKSMRLWRIREHSVWMYGEHSGIGKHNGRWDSMLWDCSDSSGLLKKRSRFDSDGSNSTKDMEITVSPEITLRHVRMSYYSQYWTFCTTNPQCNDINLQGASTKLNRDSNWQEVLKFRWMKMTKNLPYWWWNAGCFLHKVVCGLSL